MSLHSGHRSADCFDVCVAGSGPAGATAARTLALAGARVALIDRPRAKLAIAVGETVSARTQQTLSRLGFHDCLREGEHLPSTGNMATWGSARVHESESILRCGGASWHLDRGRFDAQLTTAAVEAGAQIFLSELRSLERSSRGWTVDLQWHDRRRLRSDYIIDCTGRHARVAMACGMEREVVDKLVAIWATFEEHAGASTSPDTDARTYVESAPAGWFYTARLPDRRRAVVYFTDGDLADLRALRTPQGYLEMLATAPKVQAILNRSGYLLAQGPVCLPALSTKLRHAYGRGWIAAGDSAQSFDPLSSHGIHSAIVAGKNAATSLVLAQGKGVKALDCYQNALDQIYARYRLERHHYYSLERRWQTEPFWRRRHCAPRETEAVAIEFEDFLKTENHRATS